MARPSGDSSLSPASKGTASFQQPCLDPRALLRVLGGGILISFSAVFVKLVSVGPSQSAFYRLLFGGVALLAVALARKARFRAPGAVWLTMVGAACLFALDLECWHRSILLIGPGLATILGNFQVFLVALAGALLLGERITPRHMVAIPLAFTGLWLLLGVRSMNIPQDVLWGVIFGLLTALWYAGYILLLRRSQRMEGMLPALSNMAVISLLSAIGVGLGIGAHGGSFAIPDIQAGGYLLAYGVLCQGAGWLLLSTGLPGMPASLAALVMLVQPTLSFVWDIILFGRPVDVPGMAGAALALFAIWLGLSGRAEAVQVCKLDEHSVEKDA